MERRTFIELVGLGVALGLPFAAKADQKHDLGGSTNLISSNWPDATRNLEIIQAVSFCHSGRNVIRRWGRNGFRGMRIIFTATDVRALESSRSECMVLLPFGRYAGSTGDVCRLWARQWGPDMTYEAIKEGADVLLMFGGLAGGRYRYAAQFC